MKRYLPQIVTALFVAGLIALGLVYRSELTAWFGGGSSHEHESAPVTASAAPSAPTPKQGPPPLPALPAVEFEEAAKASLSTVFDAYEEIRKDLAQDDISSLAPKASRVAEALKATAAAVSDAALKQRLEHGAHAAEAVSKSTEIEDARLEFGDLSHVLVSLVAADPSLTEERHVFSCPMATGYNKWIQPSSQLENPYMGQKMLQCGSESEWMEPKAAAAELDAHEHGDEIAYYTCPMHPSVRQPGPGTCPICGMDLTPVTKAEAKTGVIIMDSARRQLIGVKTGKVEQRPVSKTIRAVGKVAFDETGLVDVTLKYKGWIGQLYANATGQRVKRGQTLFTVYSPEVYAAQMEYLTVIRTQSAMSQAGGAPQSPLSEIARDRLQLWDVPAATIKQIAKNKKPTKYTPVASPASGYIVEKNVVAGSTVEAGKRLFRIANLDKVWIEADLYEAELPLVLVGQRATVTLPYLPDKSFEGDVTFIYPYLEGQTRTGRVRVELKNDDVELRPDMFANVSLNIDLGEKLVVPESAVIYAGPRRLVFVDMGEGKLRPQEIRVGLKFEDAYEVLSGLSSGDKIVTSGNFLVAAESRLKSSEGQW